MAKVAIKNENKEFELPDGARLLEYLQENTQLPFGCTNGECATCACVVLDGNQNLSTKNHNEIVTLQKLNRPNSARNRLACQLYIKKGEVIIEY